MSSLAPAPSVSVSSDASIETSYLNNKKIDRKNYIFLNDFYSRNYAEQHKIVKKSRNIGSTKNAIKNQIKKHGRILSKIRLIIELLIIFYKGFYIRGKFFFSCGEINQV